ncbi:hypothetical protein ACFRR6_01945 [Streptomyces sp. NPDC056891]|uniref:hypothetical protein n=1 Tax=Streptomyces sp. NPDC056891 TaxID=3345961 RepID=UPI00367589A9
MDTTFSKPLDAGRTAYVTPLITVFGAVSYEAVDGDGQRIASGWLEDAAQHGVAEEDMPAGCTHLIPAFPKPLWFTPEEVGRLTALGETAKAAFDASAEGQQLDEWRRDQAERTRDHAARTAVLHSPQGKTLMARRARLVSAVAAALDTDSEQRARAHDDEGGDPGAYYCEQQPRNEAAYEQACDALAAFDADHPQIIAALKEREAADVRRRLEFD